MSVSEADAGRAQVPSAGATAPYAASWLNRLIDWLDRLPGPRIVAYGWVTVVFVLLSNAALWVSGLQAPGTFDAAQVFWGVYIPLLLAAVDYLNHVARNSFDTFRPAIGLSTAVADDLRYRLTVIPARSAAIIAALAVPLTFGYYVLDPVGSQLTGYTPLAVVLRGIGESLSSAIVVTLVFHTIRQLGLVTQLHDMATEVDLFQPRPLYAFSRLTSRTGAALIIFMLVPVLVVQPALDSPNFWLLWAPWLIGVPAVGAAVFLLPMLGMHNRLAAEKERLQTRADERLRSLLSDLNAAVDERELGRADAVQKLLAAHQAQREVLSHLPTWPWSVGTLRGFLSALALPIVIFLIQRALVELLPS